MAKVKAEAKRIKGEAIANKKTRIKDIYKLVSEPAATPLLFVKRDRGTEAGGKKGTIPTSPQDIDGIVKRAWKQIYDGMASNLQAIVADFFCIFAHFTLCYMQVGINRQT